MKSQLRTIREKLKISTSELALRLGVSQSTAVRLQQSEAKGTISVNALKRMAAALGCRVEITFTLPAQTRTKEYHGLKRTSVSRGRKSALADALKEEERKLYSSLTAEERVLRACRLSDFSRRLK